MNIELEMILRQRFQEMGSAGRSLDCDCGDWYGFSSMPTILLDRT